MLFRYHHSILTVKKWDEDTQGDRVKVLQEIVRRSMQRHLSSLRDKIVPNLDPANKIEWEEYKHLYYV